MHLDVPAVRYNRVIPIDGTLLFWVGTPILGWDSYGPCTKHLTWIIVSMMGNRRYEYLRPGRR